MVAPDDGFGDLVKEQSEPRSSLCPLFKLRNFFPFYNHFMASKSQHILLHLGCVLSFPC